MFEFTGFELPDAPDDELMATEDYANFSDNDVPAEVGLVQH
jgi:hypothetical protein